MRREAARAEYNIGTMPSRRSNYGRRPLTDLQREWLQGLGVRTQRTYSDEPQRVRITQENFVSALLLLTLYQEIDRDEVLRKGYELIRSHGQRLDWSDHLTQDTALFVGFSREPGPSRLCYRPAGQDNRRFKAIQPSQADAVYRVAVPIEEP